MRDSQRWDWQAMRKVAIGFAVPGGRSPLVSNVVASAEVVPAGWGLARALPRASLVLVWPEHAPVPRALAKLAASCITYPVPGPMPASLTATVAALASAGCDGIIVLAADGATPYLPAYIAYLAGIERRAGMTAEFGGGVMTDVVPPPQARVSDAERHARLLGALGLTAPTEALDRRHAAGATARAS